MKTIDGCSGIPPRDKEVLRELGRQIVEFAASPINGEHFELQRKNE